MQNNNTYFPAKRSNIDSFFVMNVLSKANRLESEGKEIFHLELGEPVAKTPNEVKKEIKKLIKLNLPGYTPSNGILELRKKISKYYKNNYSVEIDHNQIFVTTGSSGAFLLTFLACFDPGDKVAIFSPVYPAYRNILKSLNIEVIEIGTDKNNIDFIDVKKITKISSINGLIISNPNNPTGQVLSKKELNYIYSYCKKNKIILISDEIYHGIEYEKKACSMLNFGKNSIVINSFSKFFCMPGWRLGWSIVPKTLEKNFLKLAQNLFISSSNIAQFSALKSFDSIKELKINVENYKISRDIVINELSKIPQIKFSKPYGGFYVYIDIRKTKLDSSVLVEKILLETGVALTPGKDFDKINGKNAIRLSFSTDKQKVLKALKKLIKWFKRNY